MKAGLRTNEVDIDEPNHEDFRYRLRPRGGEPRGSLRASRIMRASTRPDAESILNGVYDFGHLTPQTSDALASSEHRCPESRVGRSVVFSRRSMDRTPGRMAARRDKNRGDWTEDRRLGMSGAPNNPGILIGASSTGSEEQEKECQNEECGYGSRWY